MEGGEDSPGDSMPKCSPRGAAAVADTLKRHAGWLRLRSHESQDEIVCGGTVYTSQCMRSSARRLTTSRRAANDSSRHHQRRVAEKTHLAPHLCLRNECAYAS